MMRCTVRSERLVPTASLLLAAALAWTTPAAASTHVLPSNGDLSAVVPEFNRICSDLVRARAELGAGLLEEELFADKVLDLFISADSLQMSLAQIAPLSRRPGTSLFAMDRGLRYLIDSLRENYLGIAAQNGVRFVEADQALQAAEAWRSGAGVMPLGMAEAAGP
jgi:hypothetical protein